MTAPAATVFVTGATGYVGSALVEHLLAHRHAVHAFARPGTDRAHLAGADVTWHAGDLLDAASLERALERAARAAEASGAPLWGVHAAALISYRTRDARRAWRVNVDGTEALLAAARARGVRRLCHVSSVVAVGHAPDAASVLDEHAPFNGAELGCHYVTTKHAAEERVLAARDLDLVTVNPGAVFGPSARGANTTRFLRRMAAGALGPFAPPGSLAVVGREDVAQGVRLALEHGRRGERYILTESNWTLAELLTLAARELGLRPPRRTLAPRVWRALVAGAAGLDRLRPLSLTTPQSLRLLGCHFRFDASRARDELGWRPRPFVEVLRAVVRELTAPELGTTAERRVQPSQTR